MNRNVSTFTLIRYAVGYVFIASAIMKLIVSDFTHVFAGLGLPYPQMIVLIVGITELACGILIVLNHYVRKATIPLLVIMIAALLLTKLPIIQTGFFQFAFEARLDIVMIILLYILWKK
ncbi:DoxX family protein [Saliterribacillus persicus]|uniref:Putative membrane protein YphA (DoxX/SURF4 family) n=1 Tax=Saliterribacillus persicus TaxID=930114 RepID=A0A368Y9U9_9BACI|nr:DoxX family protein [Saliterribacillus persicus]RCW76982.1 putative membrane protein YphA (DoxX/SURF4 family) [Saliterribacillus persicus]